MAIPCDMLLHPELLTNVQLIQIIQERHLRVQNLHRMARDELLDLFHQFCLPYGQRKYRDSGRGKILNKARHCSPEPSVKLNTFIDQNVNRKSLHSPCERLQPPPDSLSSHMKRIKLDNRIQNNKTSCLDINENKRRMSIDTQAALDKNDHDNLQPQASIRLYPNPMSLGIHTIFDNRELTTEGTVSSTLSKLGDPHSGEGVILLPTKSSLFHQKLVDLQEKNCRALQERDKEGQLRWPIAGPSGNIDNDFIQTKRSQNTMRRRLKKLQKSQTCQPLIGENFTVPEEMGPVQPTENSGEENDLYDHIPSKHNNIEGLKLMDVLLKHPTTEPSGNAEDGVKRVQSNRSLLRQKQKMKMQQAALETICQLLMEEPSVEAGKSLPGQSTENKRQGSAEKENIPVNNIIKELPLKDEKDLMEHPIAGPSGIAEDSVTIIQSKRSYRRKRLKLRKQFAALELLQNSLEPTGESSTANGKSVPGQLSEKKRLGDDLKEHIPVKRRKEVSQDGLRSFAKELSDLAVVISRADGFLVDAELAEFIRTRLSELILQAVKDKVDSDRLNFVTSGLVTGGYFLVIPMNEMARDWLLSCDIGLFNGIPIKIFRKDRGQDRSRVSIWIAGSNRIENPLLLLQGQNKRRTELKMPKWNLITREPFPLKEPMGENLIVGIPLEVSKCFKKGEIWLCYQLTMVQARLL